jgi:hypothetical protein
MTLVACGSGDPATAGNRTIDFELDLQQKNFDDAYGQLCSDITSRVALADFRATEGSDVSPVLAASTWLGTGRGEMPDLQTASQDVTETWNQIEAHWTSEVTVGGSARENTRSELWKVDLRREGGTWKLCGFTKQ